MSGLSPIDPIAVHSIAGSKNNSWSVRLAIHKSLPKLTTLCVASGRESLANTARRYIRRCVSEDFVVFSRVQIHAHKAGASATPHIVAPGLHCFHRCNADNLRVCLCAAILWLVFNILEFMHASLVSIVQHIASHIANLCTIFESRACGLSPCVERRRLLATAGPLPRGELRRCGR